MPSVVLVTGAATGIGNLTARALAAAGHTVYASMREPQGHNSARTQELLDLAERDGVDLRVVELDVQSQESADQAVGGILAAAGRLDTVVHNAGHLYVGYAEAFTPEELAHLFDINVLGIQRVNRAVLPHLRARRSGTLLYVGSTTTVTVPPFLAPYVASKAAADSLARAYSYELNPFGIETVIVMPGPFTRGTHHFHDASRAADHEVARGYAALDPLVAANEEATESLFDGVDADPAAVAEEITRLLALPIGERPFRSLVDFTNPGIEDVNELAGKVVESFITRMGLPELLTVAR
jgi:NAD(P)-dependent dehydrogenase (short-subunit alcohol dehydrogenase family)